MPLSKLGWNESLDLEFAPHLANGLIPARVAGEDKHFFRVWTSNAELPAHVTGKTLHEARNNRSKLPKVGDWVGVKILEQEQKAVIQTILSRRTQLSRKASGRDTSEQILATNVDTAFIVVAADASFNPARLERMLVMVRESGAAAVVILNKVDLCENLESTLAETSKIAGRIPIVPSCAKTGLGTKIIRKLILAGKTMVFLGTSGVGKSSLINRLYGKNILATTEVRDRDAKGRHTTAWREMIFLPKGGVVIDTPGMREFQLWAGGDALNEAFPEIEELSHQCHFRDCTHTKEKNCKVLAAVADATIPKARYQSFVKIQNEKRYMHEAERQKGWQERKGKHRKAHRVFNKQD